MSSFSFDCLLKDHIPKYWELGLPHECWGNTIQSVTVVLWTDTTFTQSSLAVCMIYLKAMFLLINHLLRGCSYSVSYSYPILCNLVTDACQSSVLYCLLGVWADSCPLSWWSCLIISFFYFEEFNLILLHAGSLQLCQTLCDPMGCSQPGSSVYGILQARTLEWVAVPSCGGSSQTQGSNPPLLCLLHWWVCLYH